MVKKSAFKWLVVGLFFIFFTACASNEKVCEPAAPEAETVEVVLPVEPAPFHDPGYDEAAVFEAFMDRLMFDLKANFLDQRLLNDEKLRAETKFLYSAFVGEDNYDATTPFGRMMGDALASRMQNNGLQVIEVRLSRSMRICAICCPLGSTEAFWCSGTSTGRRRRRSWKKSSNMKRCTR